MLYIRGQAADFDGWAQSGARGWSYEEVLPYFRKAETYVSGEGPTRGKTGPLKTEDYRTILPLTHFFVQAAQQAGIVFSPDLNGAQQEGVGYSQMSRNGRFRGSTATTFLKQARGRKNLHVMTGALATRLLFDGHRCTGVAVQRAGEELRLKAKREVILAGGAVNSPQLLQISGIGPAAHLQSIGVKVRHDLPGVGANLSDHYCVRVSHHIREQTSINELSRGLPLAREIVRWMTTGNGALTFGVSSAMAFCRSRDGLASPDIQLLFSPASYDNERFGELERRPGATIAVSIARPQSRGTIMASSADPRRPPVIRPNYLSVPDDLRVLLAGVAQARRIFAAPALAEHSMGETTPGPSIAGEEALGDFARRTGNTVYHPVGTCRMGDGPMAVVDPRLRVRGISHLRVVDASVMPAVTTSNTNAPTIMIAEKAADMIREEARA
jgi:choline dehydrogenase